MAGEDELAEGADPLREARVGGARRPGGRKCKGGTKGMHVFAQRNWTGYKNVIFYRPAFQDVGRKRLIGPAVVGEFEQKRGRR